MKKRFVSIWFRHLKTDWFTIRKPELRESPFVLSAPSHGRMVITSLNKNAESHEIHAGMVLADARAIMPALKVQDDIPDLSDKLLKAIAEWSIRFTPFVSVDPPDGLILDVTGCSHLWGGDEKYVANIIDRFKARGYSIKAAMADTVGAAWGITRFSTDTVIKNDLHSEAILSLPPEALRIDAELCLQLHKLGLHQIKNIIAIPRSSLNRRFGLSLVNRLDQALGTAQEVIQPLHPVEPYHERLPCLEPIITPGGIEYALKQLLGELCRKLQDDEKGLRLAVFKCYRADGKIEKIEVSTNRPSHHADHLYKLFEIRIPTIQVEPGIELFVLEAGKVEDHFATQEKMWEGRAGLYDNRISELIDRISGKFGNGIVHRYLPDEHHWPERSYKIATDIQEKTDAPWKTDHPRPLQLFKNPQQIMVTAPIPDYPPMLFRYKGKIHKIINADGPERIEQEWWIQDGEHRDYYSVEDEEGGRYWLFRSGHYTGDRSQQWFIHGIFA